MLTWYEDEHKRTKDRETHPTRHGTNTAQPSGAYKEAKTHTTHDVVAEGTGVRGKEYDVTLCVRKNKNR